MNTVTLEQMLTARDARAARQAALAQRFGLWGMRGSGAEGAGPGVGSPQAVGALVSVTLVVPGPVKTPPWAKRVFAAAMTEVEALEPEHVEVHDGVDGPSGLAVVLGRDAVSVKQALVEVEETHLWGRLFDLDIVREGVPVQRSEIGAPPRRCLVCGGPAAPCARARVHDLAALDAAIEELLCS